MRRGLAGSLSLTHTHPLSLSPSLSLSLSPPLSLSLSLSLPAGVLCEHGAALAYIHSHPLLFPPPARTSMDSGGEGPLASAPAPPPSLAGAGDGGNPPPPGSSRDPESPQLPAVSHQGVPVAALGGAGVGLEGVRVLGASAFTFDPSVGDAFGALVLHPQPYFKSILKL